MKLFRIILSILSMVVLVILIVKLVNPGWIKEGEKFEEGIIPFTSYFACERGLSPVLDRPIEKDCTLAPACPCYVCANCPNNECGPGENKCNCPADCK